MAQIIMSKEEIEKVCISIGKSITEEIKNDENIPVIVGIMKGSMNFMMDLIKHIECDVFCDYIQVSSYDGTETTGKVTLKRDLSFNIKDRTIILVEDIIDTGISMNFLLHFLKEKYSPKRIILVTLLDKTARRKVEVKIDYTGKVLDEDYFVYGYGLDYNEYGRNLPQVYSLSKEDIEDLDNHSSTKIIKYIESLKTK